MVRVGIITIDKNLGELSPKLMATGHSPENRIKILDGFRCLAILSVMLFHYYHATLHPSYGYILTKIVTFFRASCFGVHSFLHSGLGMVTPHRTNV